MQSATNPARSLRRPLSAVWTLLLLLIVLPAAFAQDDGEVTDVPLYEQEPYDLITLKEDKQTYRCRILNLKDRRVPENPRGVEQLELELKGQKYLVRWRDTIEVKIFEDMLLERAEALAAAGQFEAAFDHYQFLRREYPDVQGLEASYRQFVLDEAQAEVSRRQFDRALGLLIALLEEEPAAEGVADLMAAAVDGRVQGAIEGGDFRSAHALVDLLSRRFARHASVSTWRQRFQQQAEQLAAKARQALTAGEYSQANELARQAAIVWPALSAARGVLGDVHQRWPMVSVAVTLPFSSDVSLAGGNPAHRRVEPLLRRPLFELRGVHEDGGDYTCTLGEYRPPDVERRLAIKLQPSGDSASDVNAYSVSRRLLSAARQGRPVYRADWAQVLAATRVRGVFDVEVSLRQDYVKPEALLQAVWETTATTPTGAYRPAAGEKRVVFQQHLTSGGASAPGPQEIVERRYTSSRAAIEALSQGEVDVVARLSPWQAARLRGRGDWQVGPYAAPVVHVLVPNPKSPWLSRRTFRRALVYGINRQQVLEQLVGTDTLTGRVTSGPIAGGYAYDANLTARPYDPRLALTLMEIARRKVEPDGDDAVAAPNRVTLSLAHPPEDVARVTARAVKKQLALIGVDITLTEHAWPPPQDLLEEYDLVFTELAPDEPIVDLPRLFGAGGPFAGRNVYVDAILDELVLRGSSEWGRASSLLREVHRVLHHDVTLLPLWQLTYHYAAHPCVRGVGTPMTLYQDLPPRWQITPAGAVESVVLADVFSLPVHVEHRLSDLDRLRVVLRAAGRAVVGTLGIAAHTHVGCAATDAGSRLQRAVDARTRSARRARRQQRDWCGMGRANGRGRRDCGCQLAGRTSRCRPR